MAPVGSSAPAIPCESLGVTASFQLTTTETGWIYKRNRGHVVPPWGGGPPAGRRLRPGGIALSTEPPAFLPAPPASIPLQMFKHSGSHRRERQQVIFVYLFGNPYRIGHDGG